MDIIFFSIINENTRTNCTNGMCVVWIVMKMATEQPIHYKQGTKLHRQLALEMKCYVVGKTDKWGGVLVFNYLAGVMFLVTYNLSNFVVML